MLLLVPRSFVNNLYVLFLILPLISCVSFDFNLLAVTSVLVSLDFRSPILFLILFNAASLGVLANLTKDGGRVAESVHLKEVSQWNQHPTNHGSVADESKLKGKNVSTSWFSAQAKNVRSANALALPSTGIAAHVNDEEIEVEVEQIEEIDMASAGTGKGATYMAKGLQFRLPPPLPIPRNAYIEVSLLGIAYWIYSICPHLCVHNSKSP